MIEMFLAAFLGVVCGCGVVIFLFYKAYMAERDIAEKSAEKLFQLLEAGSTKQSNKGANILSLLKNDEPKKPLN